MTDREIPDGTVTLSELVGVLGRNMAEYRKNCGMTQPELVALIQEKTGKVFSRRAMSMVESAFVLEILESAAKAMELDLEAFLVSPVRSGSAEQQIFHDRKVKLREEFTRKNQHYATGSKTKDGKYNTFYVNSVSPEDVENAALTFWSYMDDHSESWTEQQGSEVMSMLFDDLNW